MDQPLNRRDIGYTIVSRFEENFRDYLISKISVQFDNYIKAIPDGVQKKIIPEESNITIVDIESFFEYLDFPDLKEIACYDNNFLNYFPYKPFSMNEFQWIMDELYRLRCKIAHIRRYFNSIDLDKLVELTSTVMKHMEKQGEEFLRVVDMIKNSPERIVLPIPETFICAEEEFGNIPNNIPIPDYEYEGGFVGRIDDITKIIALLEARQVVTISGAGGVGKTALAQKVIQEIQKRKMNLFDGIIWNSAKETKLSYLGIEDIEPTIKNYEDLLDTIATVMEFTIKDRSIEQKETDVKTIFDLQKCILIVIDNLETVTDNRIIEFIIDPHPHIKILITSRRGLGQVERRYDLKQLKEKEAIYLFRQVSKDKYLVDLIKLDDETIKKYVKKVALFPLAIKWIIGQVAIGKDINELIDKIDETTSDISLFCFDQIFSGLSSNAKSIIYVLSMFDDAKSAGILKYIVDIPQDQFEDGIQELILVSLIIPEQIKSEQGEIERHFSLLTLTRGYVRHRLDKDPQLRRKFEDRVRTVQVTVEEADRAKKQYKYSLYNLGAITEEEKIAAMIAQTAYHKFQAGNYAGAVEDFKKACTIAPRLSAIYRNWAIVEASEGHGVEADDLMEKASKLSPLDTHIWLTWGNIKRKNDRIKDALRFYQKAYELSPDDPVVLNSLGQARCRMGEYKEADILFNAAIEKTQPGSSIRHKIINHTSIADNMKRWGESLLSDRNLAEAEEKFAAGLKNILIAHEYDVKDPKTNDIFRELLIAMGFLHKKKDPNQAIKFFEKVLNDTPLSYKQRKDIVIATYQLIKIYYRSGDYDKAKAHLTPKLFKMALNPGIKEKLNEMKKLIDNKNEIKCGNIIRDVRHRNFVIIESNSSPGETFLGHYSDFEEDIDPASIDLKEKKVQFCIEENIKNGEKRKVARLIRII